MSYKSTTHVCFKIDIIYYIETGHVRAVVKIEKRRKINI